MSCEIYCFAEVKQNGGKWKISGNVFPLDECDRLHQGRTHCSSPFDWQHYGMFGFLANVRNWHHVPVVSQPKRKLPEDVSREVMRRWNSRPGAWHDPNWLTLRELLAFDYDQLFWDRRVLKEIAPGQWNGACVAEPGEGRHLSVREFLGEHFFRDLEILKSLEAPDNVRIVFWFDS